MSTEAKKYKDTLNLPRTAFAMKANLTQREPQIQARWEEMGLYARIREARKGRTRRVLHDGPPYANGDIHMGHLLNKVLKDLVVRYHTMRGFDSPYVPGWDCHGLPIEHKVAKDLGPKAASMSFSEIRGLCRVEALKWVGVQREQFKRLGVSGDWEDPYLTLDPRYEAGIMDVLAELVDRGFVFRQLKPIHWDIHDRTALAEAELEYAEHTSPSIYVNFPIRSGVPPEWGDGPWHAMIWTTTPWTLPANVAIAAHPALEYAGVRYVDPESGAEVKTILASPLVDRVMGLKQVGTFEVVGTCSGRALEGATYEHVFIDREGTVVLADYVTVEDGTGLVHTAPGHGAEDYRTGLTYTLPVISPVDASGRFMDTDDVPADLVGLQVFAANPKIVERLKADGSLYHHFKFRHSYPHGWRSKKPVIFRATAQWFIGVDRDDLRGKTLEAIRSQVRWLPSWGQARIEAMVGQRPDWCISRQRAWGVPIPVLYDDRDESFHLTGESVRFYRDLFAKEGADAWFNRPVGELVPPDLDTSAHPVEFLRKGTDILDVWFESGSSHRSVVREPGYDSGPYPAFMYLEGSDQHRGWFQSSILTAVGTTGRAPFETVLTHGFVVDDKGQKQSKSLGNSVGAVESTEKHGADVLRLMVASLDYSNDVSLTERAIKEASEAYRKIRNTFRYLLGNLEDYARFDPDSVDPATLHPIDRWALHRLNAVIREATAAFDAFDFYRAFQKIYQFCSVDLSSFYLDVLKDRLYAEDPTGPDRRAAQFVMARLHSALARMLAPITPHTSEEIWDLVPDSPEKAPSVHLAPWPKPDSAFDAPDPGGIDWEFLRSAREAVFRDLEKLRAAKEIGSNQEALVTLGSPDPEVRERLANLRDHLESKFIVSDVVIAEDRPEGATDLPDRNLWFLVRKSTYPKCERCWNLRRSVGQDEEHPTLCARCSRVIRELNAPAG
ncbi:isoleucine--tRNA ligase [Tautonia plasticadhaerens]|uniref:Isoleucine--tRNA ligase n=1 Tax=Tautonia plasticadhaerens TaxID=2527974 RepID=A0A518GXH8_9BACT|nr:isoleucine--tRNA ligase [Tautonia plasticadhaerens]QDV33304.1 Isoleucine--tRNA ligase [Tautonia plasticadhaerens]